MTQLHEPTIGKARKIAGYVVSILPSLLIAFSGMVKIFNTEGMAENMAKLPALIDYILFLGILEIALVIIYWIPKTSNLGFFLLCSFTGGIIATELISGTAPIPGIVISILLYVGTMLRKPSLSGLGI